MVDQAAVQFCLLLDQVADRADVGGDARSRIRRTDKLAQAADAVADPETTRLAAEARQAIEQLVHHVGYLEEQHKRQARHAVRRGR